MDRALAVARLLEEAALSPELFPEALTQVARLLGATELSLVNATDAVPEYMNSTTAADMHRAYFEGSWHEADLRHRAFIRAGPTQGAIINEHELVSDDIRRRDAFYQEFCSQFDVAHCTSWSYALGGETWGYSLLHPDRRGIQDAATEDLLRHLAPVAIRSGIVASRFRSERAKGMASGLGLAGIATVILDHHGKCSFVSELATAVFDAEFGIKSDRLWAANADAFKQLQALAACAQAPFRSTRTKTVVVERQGRSRPTLLIPVRVTGRNLDSWPGARIVVLIVDLSQQKRPKTGILKEALSFTESEARIAAFLAEGLTIDEICHRLSLKSSTVRQYIKSAQSKAGVRRQAQLVAIVSSLTLSDDALR